MKYLTYLLIGVLFMIPTNELYASANTSAEDSNTQIQRVRIDITTTTGYTRHLLLGFTPDNVATDGIDYGYDAQNIDNFSNDCNWIIEDERYVIQGVGAFNTSKAYPLGLFLADAGSIEFSLQALENFEEDINVFIYDSLNNSVVSITESSYLETISEGNHTNRFFITFTNIVSDMDLSNYALSIEETSISDVDISYYNAYKELVIRNIPVSEIGTVSLYDLNGKQIHLWNMKGFNNAQNQRIKLEGITSGNYIVSVKSEGNYYNKQIVVFN